MDEVREREIREKAEQETRMTIAQKMRDDGMETDLIYKYTGIRLEEKKISEDAYDMVARQVAAEMLMRGLPVDAIQMATRLPYEAIRELQQQYAGFFSAGEEEIAEPPAW